MKRNLLITVFIFFCLPLLVSETTAFESIVNPHISLVELSRMSPAELDALILADQYLIIEGTISSIIEIERSDANLILDLQLVSGRWIGLEKVEDYKCIVNINGKEWEPRFPRRRPRTLTDEIIIQNNQVLVIGKVSSYVMDGSLLKAVVDASYLRKIQ